VTTEDASGGCSLLNKRAPPFQGRRFPPGASWFFLLKERDRIIRGRSLFSGKKNPWDAEKISGRLSLSGEAWRVSIWRFLRGFSPDKFPPPRLVKVWAGARQFFLPRDLAFFPSRRPEGVPPLPLSGNHTGERSPCNGLAVLSPTLWEQ